MKYRCPVCQGPVVLDREQMYICAACWSRKMRRFKFVKDEVERDPIGD